MKSVGRHLLWMSVMAIFLAGCGQKLAFSGSEITNKQSDPNQCVPGTTAVSLPTKFLFIVDQSGSNVDGPYEHPGMATDPQKTIRYGAINSFFQEYSSKSTLSWGFIAFNGTQAHALVNSGDDQHPAFSDASAMGGALRTFLSSTDSGDTPYKAALQMAHDLIQADLASSPVAYQYRIAFLTDGYPTDYCGGSGQVCTIPDSQIASDVQSIVSLGQKSVQLSSVYYGLPDASAASRLKLMAQVGGGQFVDTNVSGTINLNDVIQVPRNCP